ncbi:TPA: hypothetical protein ACPJ07_000527 [Vibrio diabolicus]
MLYPKDEQFREMKDKPDYNEGIEMNAQQFNELKQKLSDLTASQLKSLQGEISVKLNKTQNPVLSVEEREMLSKLFA